MPNSVIYEEKIDDVVTNRIINKEIYNKVIFNDRTYNVVSDSEKFYAEYHGFYNAKIDSDVDKFHFSKLSNFIIDRNLVDDTFSLLNNNADGAGLKVDSALSANNKVTSWEGESATPIRDKIIARQSSLDSENFLDSSSWTSAYFKHVTPRELTPVFQESLFPSITKLKTNYSLGFNDVLQLNVIRGIKMHANVQNQNTNQDLKVNLNPTQIEYDIIYGKIFVVPKEIDQLKHMVDIADIYYKDFPDFSPHYDEGAREMNFSKISNNSYRHYFNYENTLKYKTSSYEKETQAFIESNFSRETNAKKIVDNVTQPIPELYKVGTIKLSDSTFYNRETGKTEIGFSEESETGEQIPYTFHGNYTRKFNLNIASYLKNIDVSFSKQIDNPVLDQYIGKVVLKTHTSDLIVVDFNKLTTDQIKSLRTDLKSEHNIELVGLERYSSE